MSGLFLLTDERIGPQTGISLDPCALCMPFCIELITSIAGYRPRILDRVDSTLFALPVVYIYLKFLQERPAACLLIPQRHGGFDLHRRPRRQPARQESDGDQQCRHRYERHRIGRRDLEQ